MNTKHETSTDTASELIETLGYEPTDPGYVKHLEDKLAQALHNATMSQTAAVTMLAEMNDMKQRFNDQDIVRRDGFAASAMNGILASCTDPNCDWPDCQRAATLAYQYADAMMEASTKPVE